VLYTCELHEKHYVVIDLLTLGRLIWRIETPRMPRTRFVTIHPSRRKRLKARQVLLTGHPSSAQAEILN